MLGELEDAILARLGQLQEQPSLKRLRLDTYGGELSDPDLLPSLIGNGPSVLITTPKVVFRPRSYRRFEAAVVFRLVISCRNARSERDTRRGGWVGEPGSYWLWEACLRQLTGWQHKENGARVKPTEFANLVNGKFQSNHLSVLGQSFAIELDWDIPEEPMPDLEGIDMAYHVPASNPVSGAHDSIELRDL